MGRSPRRVSDVARKQRKVRKRSSGVLLHVVVDEPTLGARGDRSRAFETLRRPRLFDDLEPTMVERCPRRRLDADDAFAPTTLQELEGPVVAIGIVAAAPQE